jgi:hypothetical protein
MEIEQAFQDAKIRGVDICEHLDTIVELCKSSDTIVELGVRTMVSTFAFIKAKPNKLYSYDIVHPHDYRNIGQVVPDIDTVKAMALDNGVVFEFEVGSSLEITIPKCDVLFIDTLHEYNQLKRELELHNADVKKFIILHDTTSFPELNKAISEFLDSSDDWEILKVYTNNNGLTILKRTSL